MWFLTRKGRTQHNREKLLRRIEDAQRKWEQIDVSGDSEAADILDLAADGSMIDVTHFFGI